MYYWEKISSRKITFWILQVVFWVFHFFFVYTINQSLMGGEILVLRITTITLLNCIIFYGFLSWLIPRYAEKERFREFALGSIVLMLVVALLRYWSDGWFTPYLPPFFTKHALGTQLVFMLVVQVFTAGAAAIVRLIMSRMDAEKKMAELALLQAQTELKFLKAQINPHFLFNTINNIYALAVEQSPQTPAVILQLSGLLRYLLYESNDAQVALSKELGLLENFIALYQIKYEKPLPIRFRHPEPAAIQHIEVPPLIFIHLLENAFKYSGIGDDEQAWIHLDIDATDDKLRFTIANSRIEVVSSAKPFGGIGLVNLQRHLDLRLGNHYQMDISETDTSFQINLTFQWKSI